MLAQVFLTRGAIVPAHDHHNEQFTYIISGVLRFWIGEHADAPGDVYTDVRAGEVFIPFHWDAACANRLTIPEFDPISREPNYKQCAVRVQRVQPAGRRERRTFRS